MTKVHGERAPVPGRCVGRDNGIVKLVRQRTPRLPPGQLPGAVVLLCAQLLSGCLRGVYAPRSGGEIDSAGWTCVTRRQLAGLGQNCTGIEVGLYYACGSKVSGSKGSEQLQQPQGPSGPGQFSGVGCRFQQQQRRDCRAIRVRGHGHEV